MALRYNCRIVVTESYIPKDHSEFVVLKFYTNGMRYLKSGKPFWKPDCWGKLFCYDKANTFMRMALAKDPKLYDHNYALKLVDPNFYVKTPYINEEKKLYIICHDIDWWLEKKPNIEEIMKRNKKPILEPLIEDISEMPDFDVGNNLDL